MSEHKRQMSFDTRMLMSKGKLPKKNQTSINCQLNESNEETDDTVFHQRTDDADNANARECLYLYYDCFIRAASVRRIFSKCLILQWMLLLLIEAQS